MFNRLYNQRQMSAAKQLTILCGVVTALWLGVWPVSVRLDGIAGLLAASLAAILCLAGAAVALMLSRHFNNPDQALKALLGGMAARMGIPLFVGLAFHIYGGPLAKAGLLYYLLVFYPVALLVETLLSLPASRFSTAD